MVKRACCLAGREGALKTILRSTNVIMLDFARAVLQERNLVVEIFDSHMSLLEGSVGALPRRLVVEEAAETRARAALIEAGLEAELYEDGP